MFRSAMAGGAGGAMGAVFGLFMSSMEPAPAELQSTALLSRKMFKETAREMGGKMKSYSKTFALCGLCFSACECVIEKEFARKDMYTTVVAGCAAGSMLGMGGGPQSMAFGCVGFAAFSALIEHFMGDVF